MGTSDRKSLEQRHAALARFNAWANAHPMALLPANAVAAAGCLYDLLPASARIRPVDSRGIMRMHDLLSRLDPG